MDDKTTPKHPSYNCQRGMLCPTCDKALWVRVEVKGIFSTKKITTKEQPNFCKYCGQALLPAYIPKYRKKERKNGKGACKKCVHYETCLAKVQANIKAGYYEDGMTEEEYFSFVENADCDFYYESLEKESGWIGVNDRLPERHERVLCHHKYEPDSPNIICENTYYSGGRWMSDGSTVTHWMPLPEPPKMEGEMT